jgi:hypothetical protein
MQKYSTQARGGCEVDGGGGGAPLHRGLMQGSTELLCLLEHAPSRLLLHPSLQSLASCLLLLQHTELLFLAPIEDLVLGHGLVLAAAVAAATVAAADIAAAAAGDFAHPSFLYRRLLGLRLVFALLKGLVGLVLPARCARLWLLHTRCCQ